MSTAFLKQVFREKAHAEAIIWHGRSYTYAWLYDRIAYWVDLLTAKGIEPGQVVLLQGDFSPNAVAVLLGLIEMRCVSIPVNRERFHERDRLGEIALVSWTVEVDEEDAVESNEGSEQRGHVLDDLLRSRKHPGVVFFTSGSTGVSKAVVHDLALLLSKYMTKRHDLRTLAFLLFDHIG